MKISGGIKENGIVIGNAYDKYGSQNSVVRRIMNGFNDLEKDYFDIIDMKTPLSWTMLLCSVKSNKESRHG